MKDFAALARIFAATASGFVFVVVCVGIFWLYALGHPPPAPPALADPGAPREKEVGTTWVPSTNTGIFGNCTRILSIDGGGVRGIVPALLLAEIERRTRLPISKQFDLMVGTSTGSILALGLARPSDDNVRLPAFSAADLVQFYRDNAEKIYPNSYGPLRAIQRLFRPKFTVTRVERLFRRYFGDVRLGQALTHVAVPAYDVENGRRLWFLNAHVDDSDPMMRDLVRAATAAPTYYPPARLPVSESGSANGSVALIDGSLFANNPAQDALLFGRIVRSQPEDGGTLLLSLGTGRAARKHTFEEAWGWGKFGWLDPLLDIAFADPAIDEAVSQTLEGKGQYYRFQVDLGPNAPAFDDSSPAARTLLEAATAKYIASHDEELSRLVTELLLPRHPDCSLAKADAAAPPSPPQGPPPQSPPPESPLPQGPPAQGPPAQGPPPEGEAPKTP